MNLSDYTLSKHEEDVLQNSLKFCPSRPLDQVGLCHDFSDFVRRIRLKEYFNEDPPSQAPTSLPTHKRSEWTPPEGRNYYIDKFAKTARSHLDSFLSEQSKQKTNVNIPSAQTQAIKKLRRNTDIVIRPADKGGATTILNTADYIKEAEQQLSNCHFYKLLQDDPSGSFQSKVGTLCNQLSENGATTVKELIPGTPD
ncbi:hypothetical protein HOLleu_42367 [Holothuria leucospilota]|uniref:Uncharacterized protein n=1 Tax=Holothuria leucospilota TaxID=206669 RepID=A0A9Q0YCX1_HOLLE|nr:hypothetical protein HOLleu_42367 [Holothuria leucospilota]